MFKVANTKTGNCFRFFSLEHNGVDPLSSAVSVRAAATARFDFALLARSLFEKGLIRSIAGFLLDFC